MELNHVLVAGGGSGGHIFPALAVAEELAERGWHVSWLGRVEGMERDLVRGRGLDYHGVGAAAVVGRSAPARLAAMTRLGVSALRSRGMIRRLEVNLVLGTGGYVSVPGVIGAVLAHRPSVLLEPNAEPGAANRLLSRWASAAAVAAPDTGKTLRCPVEETGVPIRREFARQGPPPDSEGPLRLLILGGSQGARQLNQILPRTLRAIADTHPVIRVTHQVGADQVEEARRTWERHPIEGMDLAVVPFLKDIQGAMSSAHLVISRAGAVTLAEICAVGRAALLLPLPLAGSHQVTNARRLAAVGGAAMVEPEEVTDERLQKVLVDLISDRGRLLEMGQRAAGLAQPRAAARVADLVEKVRGRA